MADQNEWAALAELRKSIVEFEIDLREGARLGPGVAPGIACAVVGAGSSEGGNAGLDERPVDGEIAEAVFNDHGGDAGAGAIQVKMMATEVDEFTGGRRRCDGRSECKECG